MRRRISCGVMAAMLVAGPAVAQPADKIFTMANYPVEARANDAVAAKSKAIADGQRNAFRSLLKRLVPVSAYGRLRKLASAANPASLVDSVSVRSERNSTTEYIANLDFRFQADGVRALLDREGIPFADRQAPAVTIVPIWRLPADTGGLPPAFSAARGQQGWMDAWKSLDLESSLTPVKLETPKAEIHGDTMKAVAAADPAQWRTFAASYAGAGDRIVAAVAEPDVAKRRLNVTLFGYDAAGALSWRKPYRVDLSDAGYAIELAAVVSLGVLEGRWKVITVRGGTAVAGGNISGGAPLAASGGGALQVSVEFRGMAEWQDISRRLSATPGVDNVDVLGLSGRSARVTFNFAGGQDQLAAAVATQGMQLRQGAGGLVLALQ